jgi:glycosyltransferase involved in cell wall biosynthesis
MDKIMPKVSVILTSYNHEKFIKYAIESVLAQTYSDYELIIWDDASSDNSWEVINSYKDGRIKAYRNKKNMGGGNLNRALEGIAGEYIAIHHSDDVWEPEKLEKQVAFLDAHDEIGAVFTNALAITEDGSPFTDEKHSYFNIFDQPNRTRHEWLRFFFNHGNALCHPSVLIRKSCYADCGLYRLDLAQLPDFDMWIRLCLQYEIHVLPEKHLRFRVLGNEANASGNRQDVRIRGLYEFYKVLSNYRKLTRFDGLVKIFPSAVKYDRKEETDMDFVLAMVSLEEKPFTFTQLFGLDILFEIISDPVRSVNIKRLYDFDYKSFKALTARHDIFSIEEVSSLYLAIADYYRQIANLNQAVNKREGQITGLNQAVEERDAQIVNLNQAVNEREGQITGLNQAVAERDAQIVNLNQAVNEREGQITGLNQAVAERDAQIVKLTDEKVRRSEWTLRLEAELQEASARLHAITQSRSWRLTKPLRFFRRNVVTHPIGFARSFISCIAMGLWRRMPLSPLSKHKLKGTLFRVLPFLFMRTGTYRRWLQAGAPFSGSSDASDAQIQIAEASSVCIPQITGNPLTDDTCGDLGMNIVGSITSESGIGEAVRADIRAIEKAGIPYVLYNVVSNSSEAEDSYKDFTADNPYRINLIHLNADSLPTLWHIRGKEFLHRRYNIGYWFWELSEFPQIWHDHFKWFNEIWVATDFCLDAISRVSPIPVVKMPLPIVADITAGFDRSRYRLNEESFIFFLMFDILSYFERKNPLAVIEAFRLAFPSDEDVELLIKCSNLGWNKEARARLTEACKGLKVRVIDDRLSRAELNNLISLTDCYVSLHRSEGLGLPLAEAMYLQKPVIATAYSGNLEFMNMNNGFLVKYKLVEIEKDIGFYKKGRVWADPDIEHAAELMRMVFDNKGIAIRTGERAASDIRTYFNLEVCGKRILDRIGCVGRNIRT